MPEFGIKECLCLVRGAFECFIKTICERGQNLEENDSEGESIHVFDNRRQAEGPDVLRFRAKDITSVYCLAIAIARRRVPTLISVLQQVFPCPKQSTSGCWQIRPVRFQRICNLLQGDEEPELIARDECIRFPFDF